jgi:hypothetical protein
VDGSVPWTCGAFADGEVVCPGIPRPGAKCVTMRIKHRTGDGGKRDGSPRRARISRKPLRREGRLSPPVPVVFALAQFFFAREPRVQRPPGLPCALDDQEGDGRYKARAKDAARTRSHVLSVVMPWLFEIRNISTPSSWRTPGPTPRKLSAALSGRCSSQKNHGLWLWVLAFARTTEGAHLRLPFPGNGSATPVLISFKIMLVRT